MNLPAQKKEESEGDALEIYYQPLSNKRRIAGLTISLLCLLVFGAMLSGHLANQNPDIVFTVFAILLAGLALAAFLYYLLTRKVSIKLSQEGLIFPKPFAPDLLFRQNREWTDIANILLGSMILDKTKTTYEYELENSKNKKQIFIYFKSGGHAAIDLRKLDKQNSEKLFMAIESWCLEFSRTPKEKKDKEKTIYKLQDEERELPKSYTELWEQEMQDHFSATNFVPLKKGDFVQDGKFRVLMPLSSGGLSAVYLVESKEKELRVLKESVIPDTFELREKAREMFHREAALLQQIDHPQIAGVYDFFVEKNRDYMLLDFIAGNTLRQHLAQHGPITEEEALSYTIAVAEIVKFLHNMDPPIIHRDISPNNLVLRDDGKITMIDFGAANQLLGSATGTLVGKQAYMAPEQFKGKADKQSDLYGLGGTLFFLLTGKDPKPLEVARPRQYNKNVSPATDTLVGLLTAQLKEDRIGSAEEVIKELSGILEHGGGTVIDTSGIAKQ